MLVFFGCYHYQFFLISNFFFFYYWVTRSLHFSKDVIYQIHVNLIHFIWYMCLFLSQEHTCIYSESIYFLLEWFIYQMIIFFNLSWLHLYTPTHYSIFYTFQNYHEYRHYTKAVTNICSCSTYYKLPITRQFYLS